MTLTQLNYIITIAETKSINKAAEIPQRERRDADERRSGVPSVCKAALRAV